MSAAKAFYFGLSKTILTLSVIVLFSNFAIAHETSESDVTKRCAINKYEVELGTQKFPETALTVALTPKEISAATDGANDGFVAVALTAKVMVDGVEASISGNLQGLAMHKGAPIGVPSPLIVDSAVPYDSKEVQIINCTIHY